MAQTGFTPLLIYSSSTATNAPTAGNLLNNATGSELAINITDGKLFYKDSSNAVQVIGWKIRPATAGGTGLTSFAVGDLIYADTTTTLAKLADVAIGNALISSGVGVAPSYGKIGLTTHVSGTLPVANGGTGLTSLTAGYIPYGNGTGAFSSSANITFNGTQLSLASDALIHGLTVGLGAGSQAQNTVFGVSAYGTNSTGIRSTAIGYFAGSVSNASFNCYVGSYSGIYNTGQQNTAIGDFTLAGTSGASTGNLNTAVGQSSQQLVTTGSSNSSLGVSTLDNLTTGGQNVAIGNFALHEAVSTNYNVAIGVQALLNYTGSGINTACGFQTQLTGTTGGSNTSLGYSSLYFNSTGSNNTAVGESALQANTASNSTGVGYRAGYNSTGAGNTFFGYTAGSAVTTGSNLTVIGNTAAASAITATNEVTLGNSSVTVWRFPGSTVVASLPSAATVGAGARAFVTNALAPAFGSTVVGGGAVFTPLYSDGTNWKVG